MYDEGVSSRGRDWGKDLGGRDWGKIGGILGGTERVLILSCVRCFLWWGPSVIMHLFEVAVSLRLTSPLTLPFVNS